MAILRRASEQNRSFGCERLEVGKDPTSGEPVGFLVRPITDAKIRAFREKHPGVEKDVPVPVKVPDGAGGFKEGFATVRQRIYSAEEMREFQRDVAVWAAVEPFGPFTVSVEDQDTANLFAKLAPKLTWSPGQETLLTPEGVTEELRWNLFENATSIAKQVADFAVGLGRKVYGIAEADLRKN